MIKRTTFPVWILSVNISKTEIRVETLPGVENIFFNIDFSTFKIRYKLLGYRV